MTNQQDIREALINNTILLVAEGGFEAATTKAITHSGNSLSNIKMNEVYIYRLFGSKENLYAVVFDRLDKELIQALQRCVSSCGDLTEDTARKLYWTFLRTWRFLLNGEIRCRCYIRYYYSVYFRGESRARHNVVFGELISVFKPLFKEEADACAIMHSVMISIFDFAIRVFNGDLENDDINTLHVFNVLYNTMLPYFRNEISKDINLDELVKEVKIS